MQIEYYQAKSLIRTCEPSIFSWAEIYLNPYQGCYHNCVYCDGKSEYYHMHDAFGNLIRVKENAPELLERFLKNKGYVPTFDGKQASISQYFPSIKNIPQSKQIGKAIINIGGGVCDVYQPAEKEVKMTRRLLEIVANYNMPLWILTKNNLVLKDLDIIKQINNDSYACVNFTITLSDEKKQRIFEPFASTTNERFDAIKKLRKEGIHSGVYFYPTLPFIGDTKENIEGIYQKAKEVGAEFIYCWGLTLKPGRSKEEFMLILEKNFPEIYTKYQKLYGNNNKYGNPDNQVFKEMGLIWPEIQGFKCGYEKRIAYCAERYVPEGRIAINLKLSELLQKIALIKSCIFKEKWPIIQNIHKAKNFIEKSQKDFSNFQNEDYQNIPITKSLTQILKNYIEEGKSQELEEMEKKAYEYINNTFY